MTSGERGVNVTMVAAVNAVGNQVPSLFIVFLKHFVDIVKPTKDKTVLIILDNHESHISVEAISFAKDNGIVLLTMPPHTSHKLQPLDRTVFGPYKTFYNKVSSEWMATSGKPITIYDVAGLIGKAYSKSFTIKNVTRGFEVTGIWPFNADIFGDDEFLPAFVTDRPQNHSDTTVENTPDTSFNSVDSSNTNTNRYT